MPRPSLSLRYNLDGVPVADKKPSRNWYRGRFVSRWEVSSFEPEDAAERWWASFEKADDKAAELLIAQSRGDGTQVRLYGEVSDLGQYGHMGLYHREFRIEKVGAVTRPPKLKEATS